MDQHVYARLTGFGWTLIPLAPFRFERVDGQDWRIEVSHDMEDGARRVTLDFGGDEPAVHLGEGTSGLGEVLDLIPGTGHDHWRIETTVFTTRWPEPFALASPPPGPGTCSPFDLHGPEGALVYVQGPLPRRRVRPLARMAAPGQAIRRHGRSAGRSWWPVWGGRHPGWSWVELGYQHEGAPWQQVYRLCDLGWGDACLVTSQSPERWADLTAQAAEEVASSVTRFGAPLGKWPLP